MQLDQKIRKVPEKGKNKRQKRPEYYISQYDFRVNKKLKKVLDLVLG